MMPNIINYKKESFTLMWLFTKHGFYSVVQNSKDPEEVLIRSRVRADHEAAKAAFYEYREGIDVGTDYRYRLFVKKQAFHVWIMDHALAVDYPNFKNEVERASGDPDDGRLRHDAYMHVWSLLRRELGEIDAK